MVIRTFENLDPFKARREKLKSLRDDSVYILFSGKESHLSRFRAQSHFVYMTGFEEPEACAVLRPGKSPEFSLFVRDKDPSIELWDGYRYGPEEAGRVFGSDQCFSINDLGKELPALISGSKNLFYNLGEDAEYDEIVLQARKKAQQLDRRSGRPLVVIADPNDVLGELRVVKDDIEIKLMRESCELSAQAHNLVMKSVKPGMNEVQAQAHLFYSFYEQKAQREGYSSIIASGVNATVLHYRANNRDMLDGEFLLIDAGAEKSYYTADITRTYPVNGQFTEPQKRIYQAVLDVQKALIPMAQPGFSLPQLQEKAVQLLTEQMVELDLLSGRPADLIESKAYQKYYPHGIGHYLGMDVHDIGKSKIDGQPNPFQENMVITVEPGIYVPLEDKDAPEELRGLGVRIEDDVRVAKDPEVMTATAYKEIADIESAMS